jgi:NAD(P)H-dependent flavin oxidoreductase YrpB (nitropropane dioxygenase family)
VDGFVVERPCAGGHNAPPRGTYALDEHASPIYGARDEVNFEAIRDLGVPFWLGGGVTRADDVVAARKLGAQGVQVGTLFAYCRESGMEPDLRRRVLDQIKNRGVHVATSVCASSTGYPFKIVELEGSISDSHVHHERPRHCDLGYLREMYTSHDGAVGYRCSAEPISHFERKGGAPASAHDTTCLCNGLMATCGLAQIRSDGYVEPPLVTSGDDVNDVALLLDGRNDYGALDVIEWLDPRHDRETTSGGLREQRERVGE